MNKTKFLALFAAFSILLSGCVRFEQDVERLMRSPRLSAEQEEIYSALHEVAGNDITLKYPQSGDYRSAFILYDIDDDGEDEAIAFYTVSAMGTNVRVNILDQVNGQWYSMFDSVGLGPEVESICFPHMTSSERCNIIIGYDMLTRSEKTMGVYSFVEGKLVEEFSRDYTIYTARDMDKDGRDELLLLSNMFGSATSTAMLVDTLPDGIKVVSQATLSSDVVDYGDLILERINAPAIPGDQQQPTSDNDKAEIGDSDVEQVDMNEFVAVVDGYLKSGSMVTEILKISGGTVTNLLINDEQDNTMMTLRESGVSSADIDGDGFTEIPAGMAIPGALISTEQSQVTMLRWYKIERDELVSYTCQVINQSLDFTFFYPFRWENEVTIRQQPDGYEWVFRELVAKDKKDKTEREVGRELLRIRVYTNNDYFDEYSVEGYIEIGKNSLYSYYAYIPPVDEKNKSELEVVAEEVKANFHC